MPNKAIACSEVTFHQTSSLAEPVQLELSADWPKQALQNRFLMPVVGQTFTGGQSSQSSQDVPMRGTEAHLQDMNLKTKNPGV